MLDGFAILVKTFTLFLQFDDFAPAPVFVFQRDFCVFSFTSNFFSDQTGGSFLFNM